MAATAITLTAPSKAGIAAAAEVDADITNGNSLPNKPGVMLVLRNADAAAQNITFTTPATAGGMDVVEHTVSLPAGATRYFARFPPEAFGSTVTFTAGTALVKVAAYSA